jgi:hypothetical protein
MLAVSDVDDMDMLLFWWMEKARVAEQWGW